MSRQIKRPATTTTQRTPKGTFLYTESIDNAYPSEVALPPRRKIKVEKSPLKAKSGNVDHIHVIAVTGDVFLGWAVNSRYPDSPAYTGDTEMQLRDNKDLLDQFNITCLSLRSDPNSYGQELVAHKRNKDQTIIESSKMSWTCFVKITQPSNNTPERRRQWGAGVAKMLSFYGKDNRYRPLSFEFTQDLTDDNNLTYLGDHIPWDEASDIAQIMYKGLSSHQSVFSNAAVMSAVFGTESKQTIVKELYSSSGYGASFKSGQSEATSPAAILGIEQFD